MPGCQGLVERLFFGEGDQASGMTKLQLTTEQMMQVAPFTCHAVVPFRSTEWQKTRRLGTPQKSRVL